MPRISLLKSKNEVTICILSLIISICHSSLNFGQDEDSFSGGTIRIEHEVKLTVPSGKTEAIWSWLKTRYSDCSWLSNDQYTFSAQYGDEDFTDVYFDTPDLHFLKEESGVRYRSRVVHSGPADSKDSKQLLQIKLNRNDPTGLARSEIKYKIRSHLRTENQDDRHPMIRLLKSGERGDCKNTLRSLSVDPYSMKPVLTIKQNRRRIYLNDLVGAFATLTLDVCSTNSWATDIHWVEIELELNEIRFTQADNAEREKMTRIIETIQKDLLTTFPDIDQDQMPKYNKAFVAIEKVSAFPVRRMIGFGIRSRDMITYSLLGLMLLALLVLLTWKWCKEKLSGRQNLWVFSGSGKCSS